MKGEHIEIEFRESQKSVITHFKGSIAYDTILYAYDQVVNSPQYCRGMVRIWNLTHADLSELSDENIWMAAQYSTVFPEEIRMADAALVSENRDHLPLLKIFKSHSKNAQGEIEIFDSLENAIDWAAGKRDL